MRYRIKLRGRAARLWNRRDKLPSADQIRCIHLWAELSALRRGERPVKPVGSAWVQRVELREPGAMLYLFVSRPTTRTLYIEDVDWPGLAI